MFLMPCTLEEAGDTEDEVAAPLDSGANLKSISHRCHPILVAFVWELTKETFNLPLGCLQGGVPWRKQVTPVP